MTTIELAQHLVMVSRVSDPAQATPAQKQELALVMTQAIQEYFRLAPMCHRRTTLSATRPALETVTVTVTNGSVNVSGTPFLARQRGCSVLFPDGRWNEVTGPSSLLHEVTQTTGTHEVQVYNDALAFDDFQVDRIVTDPEVEVDGGQCWLLSPWLPSGARSVTRPSMLDLLATADRMPQRRHETASHPTHYWSEHIGGSIATASDAVFQFRFWPAPSESYQVTFDAEILPDTYRITDILSASTLPVPEGRAQEMLVPLARARLARVKALLDPEKADKGDLLDAGEEARLSIRQLPPLFSASHQGLYTEPGY